MGAILVEWNSGVKPSALNEKCSPEMICTAAFWAEKQSAQSSHMAHVAGLPSCQSPVWTEHSPSDGVCGYKIKSER